MHMTRQDHRGTTVDRMIKGFGNDKVIDSGGTSELKEKHCHSGKVVLSYFMASLGCINKPVNNSEQAKLVDCRPNLGTRCQLEGIHQLPGKRPI